MILVGANSGVVTGVANETPTRDIPTSVPLTLGLRRDPEPLRPFEEQAANKRWDPMQGLHSDRRPNQVHGIRPGSALSSHGFRFSR